MPIYEYRCEECNREFTLLQKMGATEKDTTCPHCGSSKVKKMLSAFACSFGPTVQGNYSSGSGIAGPT